VPHPLIVKRQIIVSFFCKNRGFLLARPKQYYNLQGVCLASEGSPSARRHGKRLR
jgi:hypothetical protein